MKPPSGPLARANFASVAPGPDDGLETDPTSTLTESRCKKILETAAAVRVLVVGDLILDQFVWGRVRRISPEAPVPIVDFDRESFMPGGAANVAFNLRSLGANAALFGAVGRDEAGRKLAAILSDENVDVRGLLPCAPRRTSVKMRIVSGQQQITRLDRETITRLTAEEEAALGRKLKASLRRVDAVIVGDYGKGVVTHRLLNSLRRQCRERGLWLSLDPKPTHALNLRGLSLLTPNRREAFQLAGLSDSTRASNPLEDAQLLRAADRLMARLQPKVLLITLGELGMLLRTKGRAPIHIGTTAREVFDVSGAGDTVIAGFTMAIAAGASPEEAATIANHAAGVVVGKIGTAVVTPLELLGSFSKPRRSLP